MANLDGDIAQNARSELPETYDALRTSSRFGEPLLERRLNQVEVRLFGAVLTVDEEGATDDLSKEYAGIMFALTLINPGIDYWGKQRTQATATGKGEISAWKDRASDLKDLRTNLLIRRAELWPDVATLLPQRRGNRTANVPRVVDLASGINNTPSTSDPAQFESAWGPPR